MTRPKASDIEIKKFATHHVITQPNPLRKVLRRVSEEDADDPVARAEQALAGLAGEFKDWMLAEADRLCGRACRDPREWLWRRRERRAVPCRPRHQGRCRDLRLPRRRGHGREPVPDHRACAGSGEGAGRVDRAPHQCDPGDRARSHKARYAHGRQRTQPAAPPRRRRISHACQPRPARASGSDQRARASCRGISSALSFVIARSEATKQSMAQASR